MLGYIFFYHRSMADFYSWAVMTSSGFFFCKSYPLLCTLRWIYSTWLLHADICRKPRLWTLVHVDYRSISSDSQLLTLRYWKVNPVRLCFLFYLRDISYLLSGFDITSLGENIKTVTASVFSLFSNALVSLGVCICFYSWNQTIFTIAWLKNKYCVGGGLFHTMANAEACTIHKDIGGMHLLII